MTYEAQITYSYEGDIYVTSLEVQAVDVESAEQLARGLFHSQNIYDDIKEIEMKEIQPLS